MQFGKPSNLHPFLDFRDVPGRASGDLGGLRGVPWGSDNGCRLGSCPTCIHFLIFGRCLGELREIWEVSVVFPGLLKWMQVGKLSNLHPFLDFGEVSGRASGDMGGLRAVAWGSANGCRLGSCPTRIHFLIFGTCLGELRELWEVSAVFCGALKMDAGWEADQPASIS